MFTLVAMIFLKEEDASHVPRSNARPFRVEHFHERDRPAIQSLFPGNIPLGRVRQFWLAHAAE